MDKNKDMINLLSSINKKLDKITAMQRINILQKNETNEKDDNSIYCLILILIMFICSSGKGEDKDV